MTTNWNVLERLAQTTSTQESGSYKGIDKLTGCENYAEWAMQFIGIAMKSKWLDTVLEVPQPVPGLDAAADQLWNDKNADCYAFIVQTVSHKVLMQFRGVRNAKELWDGFLRLYANPTNRAKIEASEELRCIKIQPDESLTSYFTRARCLIRTCVDFGRNPDIEETCIQLLKGLPIPEFSSLKDTLLHGGVPLTIDRIQTALQEKAKEIVREKPLNIQIFSATDSMRNNTSSNIPSQITHTNPKNQQPIQTGQVPRVEQVRNPSGRVCIYCKSPFHVFRQCEEVSIDCLPPGPRCLECFGCGHSRKFCGNRAYRQSLQQTARPGYDNKDPSRQASSAPSANLVTVATREAKRVFPPLFISTGGNGYNPNDQDRDVIKAAKTDQAELSDDGNTAYGLKVVYKAGRGDEAKFQGSGATGNDMKDINKVRQNNFVRTSFTTSGKIDTGATIMCVRKIYKNVDRSKCRIINVKLASDGTFVKGYVMGPVKIFGYNRKGQRLHVPMYVRNVVEVPNATHDLISASRLMDGGFNGNLREQGLYFHQRQATFDLAMFADRRDHLFTAYFDYDLSFDPTGESLDLNYDDAIGFIDNNPHYLTVKQALVDHSIKNPTVKNQMISDAELLQKHGMTVGVDQLFNYEGESVPNTSSSNFRGEKDDYNSCQGVRLKENPLRKFEETVPNLVNTQKPIKGVKVQSYEGVLNQPDCEWSVNSRNIQALIPSVPTETDIGNKLVDVGECFQGSKTLVNMTSPPSRVELNTSTPYITPTRIFVPTNKKEVTQNEMHHRPKITNVKAEPNLKVKFKSPMSPNNAEQGMFMSKIQDYNENSGKKVKFKPSTSENHTKWDSEIIFQTSEINNFSLDNDSHSNNDNYAEDFTRDNQFHFPLTESIWEQHPNTLTHIKDAAGFLCPVTSAAISIDQFVSINDVPDYCPEFLGSHVDLDRLRVTSILQTGNESSSMPLEGVRLGDGIVTPFVFSNAIDDDYTHQLNYCLIDDLDFEDNFDYSEWTPEVPTDTWILNMQEDLFEWNFCGSIATNNNFVPGNYKEAISDIDSAHWKRAMDREIEALEELRVWDLVDRVPGTRIMRSKWVFAKKFHKDGSLQKFKARLVACGCGAREGVDFDHVSSPVARLESVRLLLSYASRYRLSVRFFDVKNAYLNATVSHRILLQPPRGYYLDVGSKVCLLRKALYGLRQSGRLWFLRIREILLTCGMTQSHIDPCIFYENQENQATKTATAIHVDDFAMIGRDNDIDNLVVKINVHLTLIETENTLYLGLMISVKENGIYVSQQSYVEKIILRFGLQNAKPVCTPLAISQDIDRCEGSPLIDKTEYQSLLGCLLYLVVGSRVDLSFPVTTLARFSQKPTQMHFNALKRVAVYAFWSRNLGLFFPWEVGSGLQSSCDASWCTTLDGRGFSGYLIICNGGPLVWKTKKQREVALSSAESELIALVECIKEVVTISQILDEFVSTGISKPHIIRTDSKSVIDMIDSLGGSSRSKHYSRKVWFVRDQIDRNLIKLQHVSGKLLAVDLLTKAFSQARINQFKQQLGLQNEGPDIIYDVTKPET